MKNIEKIIFATTASLFLFLAFIAIDTSPNLPKMEIFMALLGLIFVSYTVLEKEHLREKLKTKMSKIKVKIRN